MCSVKINLKDLTSFKYYFVVGSVIIGSVGRWVGVRLAGVSVVGWLVVGGRWI